MTYQPIENYGIVGDMHTVALVGTDGSIDWLWVPDFDSTSVFAAILDDGKGGCFKIAPVGDDVTCKQFYWPDTNVLITRFLGPHGAAELADFMPAGRAVSGDRHCLQLVRRITLASQGRRRVGGTWRSTRVCLFETHVLGRARSRHPPRRQALVSCPTRPLAQSP